MEPINESDSSDQVFPQTPTIRRNRSRRNNFQDQFQDSTENRDPERKIIIVGYPFTGSKTLTSALSILGYRCADETTHFTDHLEFWYKIANCTQQDPNIFKRMYEDYDVISGAPLIYFWEYILKCFPKSKIIFLNKEQDRWIDEATEMFNDYFYSYEHLALSCNLIFPNWLIKKFCRRLYVILAVTRWNFNQLLGPFNCDCNLMTGDLAAYIFLVFFQRCNWVENFNQIENLNSTSNSDNESPRNSQNEGGKNNNSNNNNSKKILINYLNSFKKPNLSKMLLLKKYTEHNQYINYIMPQCSEMANFFEMVKGIKQNGKNFLMKFCAFRHFFKRCAMPDKYNQTPFLHYDISLGWGSLCEFLERPMPMFEFPRGSWNAEVYVTIQEAVGIFHRRIFKFIGLLVILILSVLIPLYFIK